MTEITPLQVGNVLTAVKSAAFVGLKIATKASSFNKTNGKRKKDEKVPAPAPIVKTGTYRGQINRDWEIAVKNARLDEGLDPEAWVMDVRRNGLEPVEDRPASTLVVYPGEPWRSYVRLVHRVAADGTEIQVDKSRYFHGEGGPEFTAAQLAPFWKSRKETELEYLSRYQGDPDRPLARPVMYRDITLSRIREIRAHGDIWVVVNPIIEFPPPDSVTQEVEGATGAVIETDADVAVEA